MARDRRSAKTISTPEIGATPAVVVPARSPRRPGGLPTHLSLPRQVWALSLWPMFEQLLGWLVWFIDTALAGHLVGLEGQSSLEAVGGASYVTWLMGLLQGAIGVGATALIARAVGARHRREARAAVGQAITLAIIWGSAFGVFFFFTAGWWSALCNFQGRTAELSTMYIRMMALVAPFMSVLFVGGSCLRGAGDTRTPFLVMVVVNVVNAIASLTFVIADPPLGGHALLGIAWGTMVAWTVGAGLMVVLLLRGRGGVRLHLHRMRWHKRMMGRLLRVGLPSLGDNGSMWLGNFLVLYVITHELPGMIAPAGSHIIGIRLEGLSFLPGYAFSVAAATMVGQYLGAGDRDLARRAAWTCWKFAALIMVSLGVLFMVVPAAFVWLVTDQALFIRDVPPLLFMAGWAQIAFATHMVFAGAIRGAGDTRTAMIINLAFTFGVRLPLVILAARMDWLLVGVWAMCSVELVARAYIFLVYFQKGRWARVDL